MTSAAEKSSPVASGDYSVARVAGELVYTAGMTPRVDGVLVATGLVGRDIYEEVGYRLAAIAATRALEAAESALEPGQRLVDALSITVFIAVDGTFTRLSQVADGASRVIRERFPLAALPVRAAVGVAALPGGAPVELQLVLRVRTGA